MKKFLIWVLCQLILVSLFSQSRINVFEVPIFQSAKDSIEFAAFQTMIQRIISKPANEKGMYSIDMAIKTYIRPTPVSYRKVYISSDNYFPFDSLLLIKDFSRITSLTLSNRDMKKLPDVVYECKNLRSIELVNTRIGKLPRKFKSLHQLESIYLLNNRPKERLKLGKNETIKTFAIRGEKPALIPVTFKQFINLERLDLASNALTIFPSASSNLKLKN